MTKRVTQKSGVYVLVKSTSDKPYLSPSPPHTHHYLVQFSIVDTFDPLLLTSAVFVAV